MGEVVVSHVWEAKGIETSKSPKVSIFSRYVRMDPFILIYELNQNIIIYSVFILSEKFISGSVKLSPILTTAKTVLISPGVMLIMKKGDMILFNSVKTLSKVKVATEGTTENLLVFQ